MLKKNILYIILTLLVFVYKDLNCQSFIGTQSNYSGSRAIFMNPSLMSTSNLCYDYSFIGFNLTAYNNYIYMKSSDVKKMAMTMGEYMPKYDVNGKMMDYLVYSGPNYSQRYLNETLDLNLFSFMYDIDGRQAVGMSLNTRVYTNVSNIPSEIIESFEGRKGNTSDHQHFEAKKASVTTMEWAEIALAYSNTVYELYQTKIDAGVSLKYLMGYSAAVINVNNLGYNRYIGDTIVINNLNADLAYSLPINYNEPLSSNAVFDKTLLRGNGLALDLGFTYTYKSDTRTLKKVRGIYTRPKIDYIWRFGVSLMDVGFIGFKNNAADNHYNISSSMYFDVNYLNKMECFDELSTTLSAICYDGDSLKARVDDRIRVGLPTTLRLQFDYNIYENYYVNATIIQPIKLFKYSVKSAPRIMVEPRYESELFDLGLPISWYNYDFLRLGASVRIAFITIGTEKLGTFLGFGDTNGMDVYVSFKFGLGKARKMGFERYDACWSSF